MSARQALKYITTYQSPLGLIYMASDGEFLTHLWFDRQKYAPVELKLTGDDLTKWNNGSTSPASTLSKLENGSTSPDSEANVQPESYVMSSESSVLISGLSDSSYSDLPVFLLTKKWLDIYFDGKEPDFIPPLQLSGSDFRKRVGEIMLTIPYGETMTYGEIGKIIAKERGKERMSAQAVGGAVGHNPIGIIVPCHRVVASDGKLTGYAGGLDKKKYLLELEAGSF